MLLPSSHCALTFCNKSAHLFATLQHPSSCSGLFPARQEKRKGRGRKDEGKWKEVGLLTVQILPQWHPSQLHPSCPDANGCYRPAPSPPCPNHPQPPLHTIPPTPFLASMAEETWHRNELKLMTLMSLAAPLPMSAIITAAPASGSKWLWF